MESVILSGTHACSPTKSSMIACTNMYRMSLPYSDAFLKGLH